MTKMRKNFVTFYSPGTFFDEITTKEIDSWDVEQAVTMAHDIVERYNATPYGFRFSTSERGEEDFNSKEVAKSQFYHLGGKIETVKDVEKRNDPSEQILLGNMKGNHWDKIVVNTNSWKHTAVFEKGDCLLKYKP